MLILWNWNCLGWLCIQMFAMVHTHKFIDTSLTHARIYPYICMRRRCICIFLVNGTWWWLLLLLFTLLISINFEKKIYTTRDRNKILPKKNCIGFCPLDLCDATLFSSLIRISVDICVRWYTRPMPNFRWKWARCLYKSHRYRHCHHTQCLLLYFLCHAQMEQMREFRSHTPLLKSDLGG